MSYLAQAANYNRRPLSVVELDFDNKIAASGVERFADGNVPLGQTFESAVTGIDYAPSKITDSGLGYRCSVTVTLQDFPHPSGVGTYFGRLFAANPYYIQRKLIVYRGFEHASFSLSNMMKGVYFIKKIDGPDDRGKIRITATDVLTKLDGDQAVYPIQTNGNLSASITDTFTGSVNIGDNTGFASDCYAIIDSEIVHITGKTGTTNVTIGGRGQYGTTAAAHDADAPCRVVGYMAGANVVDFIYFLIVYFTNIDFSTYITLTDWQAERDTYLQLQTVYGVVKEPTPVKEVIETLCKCFNIAVWWDDEAQKIRLKALGPSLTATKQINTKSNILNSGHSITRDQSKAVSQVWVYFEKLDHSKDDNAENYGSVYVYQDPDLEGSGGLGQPAIEKVFCPFIPAGGTASASKTASRISAQRKKGAIEFKFRLDVGDIALNLGDGVELTSDINQGVDGLPAATNTMITERLRRDSWVEYTAFATGVEIGARYATIAANSQANYTSATATQKSKYGFIASDSNVMSNGDDAYQIL